MSRFAPILPELILSIAGDVNVKNGASSVTVECVDKDGKVLIKGTQPWPFIEEPVRTVAVGGTIRIANGCRIENGRVVRIGLPRNLLALFQTVEYLRAFLMARLAWSRVKTLTIISGAFGLFRRQIAVAVGGYSHDTVGEDFELIVKIHRHMRDLGEASGQAAKRAHVR